jgi:acetoacetyl-CoA synthetase
VTAFAQGLGAPYAAPVADYAALHRWSIEQPEQFWPAVWDFCEVIGEPGSAVLADRDRMPGARWFPEARLNFAENLLRLRDDSGALVFCGEGKLERRLSHAELYTQVARLATALRA